MPSCSNSSGSLSHSPLVESGSPGTVRSVNITTEPTTNLVRVRVSTRVEDPNEAVARAAVVAELALTGTSTELVEARLVPRSAPGSQQVHLTLTAPDGADRDLLDQLIASDPQLVAWHSAEH